MSALVTLGANASLPKGSTASVKGNPAARFKTMHSVKNILPFTQTFPVELEAEKIGEIAAPAGELTVIETPVAGWLSISNPKAAMLGRAAENTAQIRLRRARELRAPGFCTYEALRAKLLMLDGVRAVVVFNDDRNIALRLWC